MELVARRERAARTASVMQWSVHVHVTCEKRPTRRRSTVGCLVSVYGAKFVVTRSRFGSTHFVSATIGDLRGQLVAEEVHRSA